MWYFANTSAKCHFAASCGCCANQIASSPDAFWNSMAHGASGLVTRPQSSPLMKLPSRPAASPVGTIGATKSVT